MIFARFLKAILIPLFVYGMLGFTVYNFYLITLKMESMNAFRYIGF
jgi:hypothetical protein